MFRTCKGRGCKKLFFRGLRSRLEGVIYILYKYAFEEGQEYRNDEQEEIGQAAKGE